MLNKLRERRDNESGFTLIELLVVILIIGILAAIALPAFLGQQAKGQDSSAKSDARNMVSQVESCYATTQDYTAAACQEKTQGNVTVKSVTGKANGAGYTIVADSKSGNSFTIEKSNATTTRSCSDSGTKDGGCNNGSW